MYVSKDHMHTVLKIRPIAEDSLTHSHHTQEYVLLQGPKQHCARIHLLLDNL